ncbi:MAG: ribosome biogenesis GTPase YlqF [Clostridia bacterium]|nr:ribosome biogenesis GTPase YlqF [Clostridia bacterium]
MHINWYPGHMAAAKRMMEENLKLVDLVIEICDARIPFSSRNPDIEKFDKPRIILLNKADLADKEKTRLWLDYFKQQNIPALLITATRKQTEIVSLINKVCAEKQEHFRQKGITRTMRALVAGIPNVGKSTLINSLCGSQKAKTGDKPGVTRGKQWIKTGAVDLLDSPGLLWPRLDNQLSAKYLAFTGALNDEILDLDELALELLKTLKAQYPENVTERYKIELTDSDIEDYEAICTKRGFILKNREFDYSRCARVLLDEFRKGTLGNITLEVPDEL